MNPNCVPRLLNLLRSAPPLTNVVNPYVSSECLRNLGSYLRGLCELPYSGHLLIGEAPGYKGCAITGIPFTSQHVLATALHPFFAKMRPSLVVSGEVSEATATIVWDYLGGCDTVPAMWNVFPFHPHKPGNLKSNRTPTIAEVRTGMPFLQLVLDTLCPDTIIAVGGTAARTLAQVYPAMKYVTVRHPSFGGKTEFISGIRVAGVR